LDQLRERADRPAGPAAYRVRVRDEVQDGQDPGLEVLPGLSASANKVIEGELFGACTEPRWAEGQ
jgi:hypothetical protein